MDIQFFAVGCRQRLSKVQQSHIEEWVEKCAAAEEGVAGEINIILCHDDHIVGINREYLGHDYPTDIITFDNCSEEGGKRHISGELFISIDTVKENAARYGVTFYNELHRVIIHGILHLLGYCDKEDVERAAMRAKEDHYLGLIDV